MRNPDELPFPFFAPSDRLEHEDIGRADVRSHPDYPAIEQTHLQHVESSHLFQADKAPDERSIPQLNEQHVVERLHLGMKLHEKWLVDKTKARVAGTEDPIPEKSREEIVQLLAEEYRLFGIAEGEHSARQLIREYESAVEDRARNEIGGQSR